MYYKTNALLRSGYCKTIIMLIMLIFIGNGCSGNGDGGGGGGDTPKPTVTFIAAPEEIQIGESSHLTWESTNATSVSINNNIGNVSAKGSKRVTPNVTTIFTITASGSGGTAVASVTVKVTIDPVMPFDEHYNDLIPDDSTAEYNPKRFSVVTGVVQNQNGSSIQNVSIKILSHSEYGTALTDVDGRFSIPVEGGGTITIIYQKEGLLSTQRQVYVPWNDIAIVETIEMIAQDTKSTEIFFDGNADTITTHQSSEVTDEFGTRSATIVFTGDNAPYETDYRQRKLRTINTATARATEFTTPGSMPAKLPPNSAFTYCTDLKIDGAKNVSFDKAVVTYVDNFLGFNVGEFVPSGYYDEEKGVWVPSENGVVVKLLDTNSDGVVDALDSDGDDQPNDINEDGNFSDEVAGLNDNSKYAPDKTFWRIPIKHFSSWDFNWAWGVPDDATDPNGDGAPQSDQQDGPNNSCNQTGNSFVEQRSRIFHEDIPIPGTDITLHYASNRVLGYKHKITVPVSGDNVPESLKRIIVKAEIAGRLFEKTLSALPNQSTEFVWDGLDHLGRRVGSTTAHIKIGFVYDVVYMSAGNSGQAFGQNGNNPTQIPGRDEVVYWRNSDIDLQVQSKGYALIAEGWTLSNHHYISPTSPSVLYKGDGSLTKNNVQVIDNVAGNGYGTFSGDGGSALDASLNYPVDIAFDALGNIYIADTNNYRIRKIDAHGIITTVAGNGSNYYSGDGGLATEAGIVDPTDVAVDNLGNLYISERGGHRIRKINTNGIISTIAGNGSSGYSGDGGLATESQLSNPTDVIIDTSGNLYIADIGNNCIRKIDPSGIISTVAGNGAAGYNGDGGIAIEASLNQPSDLAVDSLGNLYISDDNNHRIRQVNSSGIITTVAGNGIEGYNGDGGLATEATLYGPTDVIVDDAHNIYIADMYNNRIRLVDPSGIITTIAGNGIAASDGDGGSAIEASLNNPVAINFDAAGNIYIADTENNRIRKIAAPSKAFFTTMNTGDVAFAEKNGMGHVLTNSGLHKTTIDLDTGKTLLTFKYDEDNRLTFIVDQFDNTITIERDSGGKVTAIVSPEGIRTQLSIDEKNELESVTYADNAYYEFEYNNGLMILETEPKGNEFRHEFDDTGRLENIYDEEGGHWHYAKGTTEDGKVQTQITSVENNTTTYIDHTHSTGKYESTIMDATGSVTEFIQSADGLTVNKSLPCGTSLNFKYDIDSRDKYKYVKESTVTTEKGLRLKTFIEKEYQNTSVIEKFTVNNKTTTMKHDISASEKTITSPEGRIINSSYNPNNLLITKVSIPGFHDTEYYYSNGRLKRIKMDERETSFDYHTNGFLKSVTDTENKTTYYEYNELGNIEEVIRPDNTTVKFDYDQNGNIRVLTNPKEIEHKFDYNDVNLNDNYETPLSGTYQYDYDKDRRLKMITFPTGTQIKYEYLNGRLDQIQTPEGNIDYDYFCGTKIRSLSFGSEKIAYTYDASLLKSQVITGTFNQSIDYTYNDDFDLKTFTYAGKTEGYDYDDDGLLIVAGNFNIIRNAKNGLPEGVANSKLLINRNFNGYGELDEQSAKVSGQDIYSFKLTEFDRTGRIIKKTESIDGGTYSNYVYSYDSMGRLLTVTKDSVLIEEYKYEHPSGNRSYEMNRLRSISGRNYTYSDEDHLKTVGDISYDYDENGFLERKTNGSKVTIYEYSSRGELLSVNMPDGNVISHVHDSLGRRIAKKINGSIVEKYLWHNLTQLLAVYDGSDKLIMRFEYADTRIPFSMKKNDDIYYLLYDQVNSLRIISNDYGEIVKKIDYDSFGNIVLDSNELFHIPLGFAGGLHDVDIGLVRFGYRDYDPYVGKWTSKDPINYKGGDINLYTYVQNNPISRIDPYGLTWIESLSMFYDWVSGSGADHITFGPDTNQVRDMMDAPGVERARDYYSVTRHPDSCHMPLTNYNPGFGLSGLYNAGTDSTEQFVGNYTIEMIPNSDDITMTIVLSNNTSMTSFLYGLAPSWERDTFSYGGNMRQTYTWTEIRGDRLTLENILGIQK